MFLFATVEPNLGLAEFQEDAQPSPAMEPTRELMRVLETSRITTSLKPIVLRPIVVTEQDARNILHIPKT